MKFLSELKQNSIYITVFKIKIILIIIRLYIFANIFLHDLKIKINKYN